MNNLDLKIDFYFDIYSFIFVAFIIFVVVMKDHEQIKKLAKFFT